MYIDGRTGDLNKLHHRGALVVRDLVEVPFPFPGLLPQIDVAELVTERFTDEGIGAKTIKRLDQRARQPLRHWLRGSRTPVHQRVEIVVPWGARISSAPDPLHAGSKRKGAGEVEIGADIGRAVLDAVP